MISIPNNPCPSPDKITVRIVRDQSNRDGWVARHIPNGKVCFISNLDLRVSDLIAGDLWCASITRKDKRYYMVELLSCLS